MWMSKNNTFKIRHYLLKSIPIEIEDIFSIIEIIDDDVKYLVNKLPKYKEEND